MMEKQMKSAFTTTLSSSMLALSYDRTKVPTSHEKSLRLKPWAQEHGSNHYISYPSKNDRNSQLFRDRRKVSTEKRLYGILGRRIKTLTIKIMKKSRIIISFSTVLIITFAACLPSLKNDFTNWDDGIYVVDNPKIRELSWRNIGHIFTSFQCEGQYIPLMELSFALEYHFFGMHPRFYHATNLILHSLNCLLAFWLVLILSKRVAVAFITALLFGIHPLQVETVAWVTPRDNLLYTFFFLGTLISYLYYRRNGSVKYYLFSLFLFLVSLLSKVQGLLLPLVLLLCDYLQERKFYLKTLIKKAPFFLISAIFAIIIVIGQSSVRDLNAELSSIFCLPTLLDAGYSLVFSLVKIALPVRLSCFYPYPEQTGTIALFRHIFSTLTIITLLIGVIFSHRYTRKLIFGSLFFLFNLLLVFPLLPTRLIISADHYFYLSSIGLFYLVGEILAWLSRGQNRASKITQRTILIICIATVAGLFSFLTRQRCRVWRNSTTLWSDASKKKANTCIAHLNLGNVLLVQGKVAEATRCYIEALRIKPDYADAHFNLGRILQTSGKLEEAKAHYRQALQGDQGYLTAHYNLGIIYYMERELEKAIFHYNEALRIRPDYPEAHCNLGIALARQGKFEEAIFHYNEALRIRPDFTEALHNLKLTNLRKRSKAD